jgi:type V secretory pathway adhesin AidA
MANAALTTGVTAGLGALSAATGIPGLSSLGGLLGGGGSSVPTNSYAIPQKTSTRNTTKTTAPINIIEINTGSGTAGAGGVNPSVNTPVTQSTTPTQTAGLGSGSVSSMMQSIPTWGWVAIAAALVYVLFFRGK